MVLITSMPTVYLVDYYSSFSLIRFPALYSKGEKRKYGFINKCNNHSFFSLFLLLVETYLVLRVTKKKKKKKKKKELKMKTFNRFPGWIINGLLSPCYYPSIASMTESHSAGCRSNLIVQSIRWK